MQIRTAVCFLLLIECITYAQNNTAGIYLNWLYIIYAYISIAFSLLARKYMSAYAYLLFATAYMIFAFADTLTEFNVILSDSILSDNYSSVMYVLISALIAVIIYDKLDTDKLRDYSIMPKPFLYPSLRSERML